MKCMAIGFRRTIQTQQGGLAWSLAIAMHLAAHDAGHWQHIVHGMNRLQTITADVHGSSTGATSDLRCDKGCHAAGAASACPQGVPAHSGSAVVAGHAPTDPAAPAFQLPTLPSAAPVWHALLTLSYCSAPPQLAYTGFTSGTHVILATVFAAGASHAVLAACLCKTYKHKQTLLMIVRLAYISIDEKPAGKLTF